MLFSFLALDTVLGAGKTLKGSVRFAARILEADGAGLCPSLAAR